MLQIYYPRLTCPDEGFIYSMLLSGSRCPRDLCVAQSGDEALTMDRIAAAERLERDRTRVVRGLSNESSLVVDHRFPSSTSSECYAPPITTRPLTEHARDAFRCNDIIGYQRNAPFLWLPIRE